MIPELPEEVRDLPVVALLPELRDRLWQRHEVVLQAAPGAGKTTVLPLALMHERWLQGRRILVLEPRRLAARAAAERVARLLGEPVGETVGYRMRMETRSGPRTRIEFITEGLLPRLLQSDPSLQDVGLVIFDEFHERNLDSDLGLTLTLAGRTLLREEDPLRLIVMSATLYDERIAGVMGDAPVLRSEGRQYPVATRYLGSPVSGGEAPAARVCDAVFTALDECEGHVLVFLPGQRQIHQVAELLQERLHHTDESVLVAPLYGTAPENAQRLALEPSSAGTRKVVLATNVAETSITIDGVEAVVDAGLAREPVYDPATGMTRLATRRISRASAEQRSGRAGRQGPGLCLRMWSEEQHQRLVPRTTPQILQTDLTPLALQLYAWGATGPEELDWLDAPPAGAFARALDILSACGALFRRDDGSVQLTPHGLRLAQMPLHPRLAHMVLTGCSIGATESASLLAALLSERNPMASRGVEIEVAVHLLQGTIQCPRSLRAWAERTRRQAERFAAIAHKVHDEGIGSIRVEPSESIGVLLATAYPDRVACLREGTAGLEYKLSNGRAARLPDNDALTGAPWLAVAEVGGSSDMPVDRIYSATRLAPDRFADVLSPLLEQREVIEWNDRRGEFLAERRRLLGELVVSSEPLPDMPGSRREEALLDVVRRQGLDILPWNPSLRQWRARVLLLRRLEQESPDGDTMARGWPDLSDEYLLASLDEWLLPWLGNIKRREDFARLDLKGILLGLLSWPLPLELERLAPERVTVPSGASVAIDYLHEQPVLPVKLQEMFGCEDVPRIAGGRQPLLLHLLSPAGRPLQITADLAAFWRNGYRDVVREMRGRYPKHPWPDDPLSAEPTRGTRRRSA